MDQRSVFRTAFNDYIFYNRCFLYIVVTIICALYKRKDTPNRAIQFNSMTLTIKRTTELFLINANTRPILIQLNIVSQFTTDVSVTFIDSFSKPQHFFCVSNQINALFILQRCNISANITLCIIPTLVSCCGNSLSFCVPCCSFRTYTTCISFYARFCTCRFRINYAVIISVCRFIYFFSLCMSFFCILTPCVLASKCLHTFSCTSCFSCNFSVIIFMSSLSYFFGIAVTFSAFFAAIASKCFYSRFVTCRLSCYFPFIILMRMYRLFRFT